jgi:hypothetical protein
MSFLRHIGKIGDRKVAIVFREVPGEPHMCLVTYTETLNMHVHDPLMRCIESDIGQHSEALADALSRSYTQDGRIILQVLHAEGLLKKVQTAQVLVTPTPTTRIKLDELNKMLNEMALGEAAVKRLAEIDSSRGIQDPAAVARKMRNNNTPAVVSAADGLLADGILAKQRLEQATRMELEANGLLNESKRLREEAKSLDPTLAPNMEQTVSTPVTAKKRGRPAKVKVTV